MKDQKLINRLDNYIHQCYHNAAETLGVAKTFTDDKWVCPYIIVNDKQLLLIPDISMDFINVERRAIYRIKNNVEKNFDMTACPIYITDNNDRQDYYIVRHDEPYVGILYPGKFNRLAKISFRVYGGCEMSWFLFKSCDPDTLYELTYQLVEDDIFDARRDIVDVCNYLKTLSIAELKKLWIERYGSWHDNISLQFSKEIKVIES